MDQEKVERKGFEAFRELYPPKDRAILIFFVNERGGSNGITVGPRLAFIADRTTVNNFRATAHEIGHLLGLSHTNANPTRLLYRGANGTILIPEEIKEARRNALQLIR